MSQFSLREQLRVVLEENSRQKQLLHTEQRQGKSTVKTPPIVQVEGAWKMLLGELRLKFS